MELDCYNGCLTYFLRHVFSGETIFGLDSFFSCKCDLTSRIIDKWKCFYNLYRYLIEFVLWVHFIISTLQLIPILEKYIPCAGWYKISKSENYVVHALFVSLALFFALNFRNQKGAKLYVCLKNSGYPGEERLLNRIQKLNFFGVIYFVVSTFIIELNIAVFLYPILQNYSKYANEASYCCIQFGFWVLVTSGQIMCMAGTFIFTLMLVHNRYIKLSEILVKMIRNPIHFKHFLQILIEAHAELWTNVSELNRTGDIIVPLRYSINAWITCLCVYMAIFLDANRKLKLFIVFVAYSGTLFSILIAFSLSSFTSSMEDSFQEIRIFSTEHLGLKYKLKLLDFMKRFGKASLRMSVGGYFNVTKKFPIKMASLFYSILSSLLQLRNLKTERNNCAKHYENKTIIIFQNS